MAADGKNYQQIEKNRMYKTIERRKGTLIRDTLPHFLDGDVVVLLGAVLLAEFDLIQLVRLIKVVPKFFAEKEEKITKPGLCCKQATYLLVTLGLEGVELITENITFLAELGKLLTVFGDSNTGLLLQKSK